MSRLDGAHTHGHGGGGSLAAVLIALVLVGVVHAIWRTLVEIAWITALTVLSIAGLAAAAGLGYLALRVRAGVASRRAAPKAVIPREVIRDSSAGPSPLEPPRRDGRPLSQQEETQFDTIVRHYTKENS